MSTLTPALTASRTLFLACVGLTVLWLPACSDATATLAQEILIRTIPPGDSEPSLSEPVRSGQSLQFRWDFEGHLDATDYFNWLSSRLRDFQVVERNGSDLYMAKHVDGDAYRLHVTLESGTGVTRIHVQFTASPD